MSGWTTPADLRATIERLWLRGALPSAVAAAAIGKGETGLGETRRGETRRGETQLTFPMRMPLKRPRASDLGAQYEDVKQWVRTLEAAAAEGNFDLEWEATNNRAIGHNRVPVAAAIASADAAVRVIGRSDEAVTLSEAAADTVARFPTLTSWVVTRAPQLLQHVADWPEILSALDWFVANPRSGRYLRQIEVAGLHTKFFETKRALFAELLDIVLPVDAIDASATGVAAFERRYGLIAKPTMIRWRTLDDRLAPSGLTRSVSAPRRVRPPGSCGRAHLHHRERGDIPRFPAASARNRDIRRWLWYRAPSRDPMAGCVTQQLLGGHRHARFRDPRPTACDPCRCQIHPDG